MTVPDYIFNQLLAILKVFFERKPQDSNRYKNAVRKAILLYPKLLRLKNGEVRQS